MPRLSSEVRQVSQALPRRSGPGPGLAALRAGEVLAVVGENGAGKSTLMKILAGVHPPDAGAILLDGHGQHFRSVADALRAGICLIHQELNLAENLDVAANLFLGRETTGGPLGLLDRRTMSTRRSEIMKRVGLRMLRPCRGFAICARPAATRRDRPRPVAEGPRPHHGRADLEPDAARNRSAL